MAGVAGNNGQIQVQHYCTTALPTCTDDPTRTENFTYDAWGRVSVGQTTNLTGANTWKLQWSYDRLGNRLSQTATAGTASVTQPQLSVDQNTNRISTTGYAYDAAGNMTSDSLSSYAYDAENRLTQVNPGASPTATYTYLGALRVERQFGGTTVYVYSGTQPIAEYAAGAQLTQPNKEYIYSGSQLLATVDASLGTSYQYHDHLSTRVEADASANVTRTFGHFPFGETWYETGTASRWKFTSYERAESGESGLDYADFRYYSSRLGRFMSADPLGGSADSPQSLDRYTYAMDDPANLMDPAGLMPYLLDSHGDCTAGTGGGGTCNVDGQAMDCGMIGALIRAGAIGVCPENDCSVFSRTSTGDNGAQYRLVYAANGPTWENVTQGIDLSPEDAAELGLDNPTMRDFTDVWLSIRFEGIVLSSCNSDVENIVMSAQPRYSFVQVKSIQGTASVLSGIDYNGAPYSSSRHATLLGGIRFAAFYPNIAYQYFYSNGLPGTSDVVAFNLSISLTVRNQTRTVSAQGRTIVACEER